MRLTFVQLLLLTSYALNAALPDRVPMWHVYSIAILCIIELLFVAADSKQDTK